MRPTSPKSILWGICISGLAALALGALGVAADEPKEPAPAGMPAPAERLPEHVWLDQLVGEWTVSMEIPMGPGVEPMKAEGSESSRSIGGVWYVADGKLSMGGQSMSSMMTLGYDPAKKSFVGTWIDTMQIHLWTYTGTLDEAKKSLSLLAEGPNMEDPTKTSRYRDVIEVVSADHRVTTSSIQDADGAWTQYMRADYRRKK